MDQIRTANNLTMITEKETEDELPESEELYEKLSIVVARGQEPLRIDKFLMSRIEGATRNKIQQAIETELVLVNDKAIKNNYLIYIVIYIISVILN